MLASASEDLVIDIADVETGKWTRVENNNNNNNDNNNY